MTPEQRKDIDRLICRLIDAVVMDSWKGNADPENHEEIETRLRKAKDALRHALDELTQSTPAG
jgi:hypothetical protein